MFIEEHCKVYLCRLLQNLLLWLVGSYYRQVIHFENFQSLPLVLAGINLS